MVKSLETHGRQRENDFSGYTGYRAAGEVETCLTVSYRVLSLWPVLLVHLILPIFVHFSSPGPHSRSQRCICNCNVHTCRCRQTHRRTDSNTSENDSVRRRHPDTRYHLIIAEDPSFPKYNTKLDFWKY